MRKKTTVIGEEGFQIKFNILLYNTFSILNLFLDFLEHEFNFLEINLSLSFTEINRCYYVYGNFVCYF